MSYTFGNAGGTTWGLKTYNQIFARNSETVGAAEYWDKSNVQDFDTVICSTNHRLLTAKYMPTSDLGATPRLHWFGTGIYLCHYEDNGYGNVENGDYLVISANTSPTVRPHVRVASGTGERQEAFGVVLIGGADRDFITVATMGVWPTYIVPSTSLDGNRTIVAVESTGNPSAVDDVSAGGIGALGKPYPINGVPVTTPAPWYPSGDATIQQDASYPLIRTANATPLPSEYDAGLLTLHWGTAKETF